MMNKALKWMVRDLAVLAAASNLGALAPALAGDWEPRPPMHYAGLINDYTPSTVKNGPYVMNGKWSLEVDQRRGTNKFTAELNMETSDYGITEGIVFPDAPASRGAHTHHIVMTNGVISTADLATSCPAFIPATPAASSGFAITGSVYITVNGGKTPFANPSPMTLCVLGGDVVQYSNITLTIGTPASGHFGTFPIHGVVVRCAGPWEFESKDCTFMAD